MPTYSVTAMVLRKTKLGETDLILTLLDQDGSLKKAIAKGARKPGSKFGGRGEPATILNALVNKGKSLDVITDAKIVASYPELRRELDDITTLSTVLDFAAAVAQEDLPDPRFFQLTVAALDAIDATRGAQDSVRELLLMAFLLKGCAMHGFRPTFSTCAGCGTSLEPEERSFWSGEGGVLCGDCAVYDNESIEIDWTHVRYIQYLLGVTFAKLVKQPSIGQNATPIFHAVLLFVRCSIPARLKALEYYASSRT